MAAAATAVAVVVAELENQGVLGSSHLVPQRLETLLLSEKLLATKSRTVRAGIHVEHVESSTHYFPSSIDARDEDDWKEPFGQALSEPRPAALSKEL